MVELRLLHSCHTLSRSFGGVFEAVRQLVAAQIELDSSVSINVLGAHDEYRESDQGLWPAHVTHDYRLRGLKAVGWSPRLSTLYDRFRPELTHVHGLWKYYGAWNSRYCRSHRLPYVVSPHGMLDSWALRNSGSKKRLARWLFEDRHLQGAACLHALCPEEARSIRTLGFTNPICVIPNGVELPDSDEPNQTSPPWRGRIPDGNRVMLYLGRIHPKKGLENLLTAWRQMSHRSGANGWSLAIAGWGADSDVANLRMSIERNGLQNEVCFLGPLFGDEKKAAFRSAAGFVLPSFSEGLPMAVLEAWSYSLPVLMTPECNLQVGFEAHAAIELGTSPEDVARPLEHFFRLTDSEQAELGINGRELVAGRFTWKRIAGDFYRIYRWVSQTGERPDDLLYGE